MRISFGTLSLCAWLGDLEAVRTLDYLNLRCRAATARIYYSASDTAGFYLR